MATTQAKVTSSGQVSLPAEIRRRWGVGSVLVIDRGDYAIVRPVPADIIAALKGVRGGPGPSVEQARADERHAADERERRRIR
jgi:bifunctional DNA-binding transcriptional regulator/antitoxin component of YhaV-PrlF toxin-antitoxin module